MSTNDPPSPSLSALPPIPGSPTYSYASTVNPIPSSFNLPLPPPPRPPHAVLNKSDLEASQIAYAELLSTAKAYRLALAALSSSASTFGSALEACARLKEARSETMAPPGGSMSNSFSAKGNCTADSLLAASGVHQLIANHQQILSETVYRSFEVPLLHELDQWQRRMEEEEVTYQKEAKAMSREIRKMEKEGLRLHKQRKRDVGKFREHLVQLTMKLDSLTGLSGGHSRGLLRDCQEMSKGIVECSAGLVRAEVDIFEALARKGWNGGGLDELLEKGKDFFANETDSDAHPNHGAKIFSILPQNRSILAHDAGDGLGPHRPGHGRSDSLLVDGLPYQSLAGAMSGRDADVNSIFSERDVSTTGILNRPRGVRPFSPTPGESVEDPLNNIVVAAPAPFMSLLISKHKPEDEDSEANAEDESVSTKTVIPIFTALEPPMTAAKEESDEVTPKLEDCDTPIRTVEREPSQGLESESGLGAPQSEAGFGARSEAGYGAPIEVGTGFGALSEARTTTRTHSQSGERGERRWSVTDDGLVSD